MHDDQHGTAVVVLAGLINAAKLANKNLADCKIVCLGAGAAGTAIVKLINYFANPNQLILVDSKGIISRSRTDLNNEKTELLEITNKDNIDGSIEDALVEADIFIGVSKSNAINQAMVRTMNQNPIIFAMANPNPEIDPKLAKEAGAFIVATGRSDYPNQINNALVFPGIFRGALDNNVKHITDDHKIEVAKALAMLVEMPNVDMIIPEVLDNRVVPTISNIIR